MRTFEYIDSIDIVKKNPILELEEKESWGKSLTIEYRYVL